MKAIRYAISTAIILSICCLCAAGQSTQITYQGSLKDGANAANGNHDFEFLLYDALSGGGQLGTMITVNNVAVTEGTFSVKLDFGAQFPGANRFLEIRVRQSGGGSFTPLSPRQQIDSSPYAIRSLAADNSTNATTAALATNALQLGGTAANQFVLTGDARMSDARNPLPNSANYIQNTTNPQATSDFNISGTGRANILRAETQYNIGDNRVLSVVGTGNLFAGVNAGTSNVTGSDNSFVGTNAGLSNTAGTNNSFVGRSAGFSNTSGFNNSFVGRNTGLSNTTGNYNSFFGTFAGQANITGFENSFVGVGAGQSNTTGNGNSFLGRDTGLSNTIGISNSFVGKDAGFSNTTGSNNSFLGWSAGKANTTGNFNSSFGTNAGNSNTMGSKNVLIGFNADVGGVDLINATAVGADSLVTQSNSMVLGSINGINGATEHTNVGIGTTTPSNRLHIVANGGNLVLGNPGCSPGFAAIGFSATLAGCSNFAILGNATQTVISRPTGGVIEFREGNTTQASIGPGGALTANGAGITNLNASSLGSGTVADARLSANVALLTGAQTFSGPKTFSAGTIFNGNVGIGTTAPTGKLHIADNGGNLVLGNPGCNAGFAAIGFAATLSGCNNYAILGNATQTVISRPTGGVIEFREGNSTQMSIAPGGAVNVNGTFTANGSGITNLNAANISTGTLNNARLGVVPIANGGTGSATKNFVDLTTTQTIDGSKTFSADVAVGTPTTAPNLTLHGRLYFDSIRQSSLGNDEDALCSDFTAGPPALYEVIRCGAFSSIRFKTAVSDFTPGLNLLNRLRPVNFTWKKSGKADLGLIAEEVAEVEPLLATYDSTGQIKGVKYDRIGVVLINALKEQQTQIEAQKQRLEGQEKALDELRREVRELKTLITLRKK